MKSKKTKTQVQFKMPGGFAWHVHHDILLEWCFNLNERRQVIRISKNPIDQPIRLRLLCYLPKPWPPWLRKVHRDATRQFVVYRKGANQLSVKHWPVFGLDWTTLLNRALRTPRNRKRAELLHARQCGKHRRCPWGGNCHNILGRFTGY